MSDPTYGSKAAAPGKNNGGTNPMVTYALAVVGAAAGGALGFLLARWLLTQGFYGLILPGACLGLGCGWFVRRRTVVLGIVAGIAALALGLFTEWTFSPFIADPSFGFFLRHLSDLKPVAWIVIALGGAMGFWFGQGRDR